MTPTDQRRKVDQLIADGKPLEAAQEMTLLWASDPSSAQFVVSRYASISRHLPLTRCKIAFERSFTLEPLMPVTQAAAFTAGIAAELHLGDFNAYPQEILDPASALYQFEPDVVVLTVLTSDVAPELWTGAQPVGSRDMQAVANRVTTHFAQLVEAFRNRSASHLILHLLEYPLYTTQGVLDDQSRDSQTGAIRHINEALRNLAYGSKNVYVLDYDALISRVGKLNWRDEVKWQLARLPIKAACHRFMAQEWMRFLCPLTGKIAKVVAVDLDNTLWGGVIGEDGTAGIALGREYPGSSYSSVQRALLELRDRGLLLAICSKNNVDEVTEVFESHTEMTMKLKDFSAVRINWLDKASNLRAIAAELNVGIDSIAFIDDNPVERQQVRAALPEAYVVELPDAPLQYADVLRTFPPFERLHLSEEDKQRSQYYAAQGQVLELQSKTLSKDEFYRSLEQKVSIESVTDLTLPRAAQLTQKTNQFNLTTTRYSEQEILAFLKRPSSRSYIIRVIDRYIDNGLVGLALTYDSDHTCIIDTFLLSCRVISRGIETALLSYIAQDARSRGVAYLQGSFIPTKKNKPAENFLPDHNFALLETREDATVWRLDVRQAGIPWPSWIEHMQSEAAAV